MENKGGQQPVGRGISPIMVGLGVLLFLVGVMSGGIFSYLLFQAQNLKADSSIPIAPGAITNVSVTPTLISEVVAKEFTRSTPIPVVSMATPSPTPTSVPELPRVEGPFEYGKSFLGQPLHVYRLGNGPSSRLLVGGIHGGYEWNTVELVSETLEYLEAHPELIPSEVTLYVVPCANPDGYRAGTDREIARMNGNRVDLNRNWDYQWQITATHGTRVVSAGSAPFSEPETEALRRLIEDNKIEAVVFYHSALGGVIFSGAEAENSKTFELAEYLTTATRYRHQTEGIEGQVTTGDAIDWLSAKMGISGAEIELTTHSSIIGTEEYQHNLEGIISFLRWQIRDDESPVAEDGWIIYKVKVGDTLWGIALSFDIQIGSSRYEQFLAINQIKESDPNIVEGQELKIPPEQ